MHRKPLTGRTILVTRPEDGSSALAPKLRRLGARVLSIPVVRIAHPSSTRRLDEALRRWRAYDALVVASPNAASRLLARARALKLRLRPRPLAFAVGPATAAPLRREGWRVRVANPHRGEALAQAMGRVRGWRILLPRAEAGRELLPRMLRRKGAFVDVVTAYRTLPDHTAARLLSRAAGDKNIDAVAFTSGSAVESLHAQLPGRLRRRLWQKAIAASIGPITSAALRRRGIKPAVEAPQATLPELCRAMARHFKKPR
ncbi:MAG TPA: hypothetical protein DEB40_00685 [Elusimicrobia bacterium]|nr:hypothetical protein [Elusimicrobiota bacterium]HBT60244.1 hypothetical protein [Elusimicrobiota bacterium]